MKSSIRWWAGAFSAMILLPWLILSFADPTDVMAVVILLFFIVDPLFAVFTGLYASAQPRRRWHLPFAGAALLLAGAWLFLSLGEADFFIYAGAFQIIGFISMLAGCLCRRIRALQNHHKRSGGDQDTADQ